MTTVQLEWKSFKKGFPNNTSNIFVIVKLQGGYYPVFASYFNFTLNGRSWKEIRFLGASVPTIYIPSKDASRLIAWAYVKLLDKNKLLENKKSAYRKRIDNH